MTDDVTLEITASDLEPEVDDLARRLLDWLAHGIRPPGAVVASFTPTPPPPRR